MDKFYYIDKERNKHVIKDVLIVFTSIWHGENYVYVRKKDLSMKRINLKDVAYWEIQ